MRLNTLVFLIGEAGRNIRRNGMMSLAALSTVAITLAVFRGEQRSPSTGLHQYAEALPRQFRNRRLHENRRKRASKHSR